jgi:spore coat polysaccharide biosynthesis protein SpsF (cytidylyltransferase family)
MTVFDDINAIIGKPPARPRVCAAVSTRLSSERFERKGIYLLADRPAWWHCMQRLEFAAKEAGIELVGRAIATSTKLDNDLLDWQAHKYGYDCIRHCPEEDRPGRLLKVLDYFDCDILLHVGADTPLAMTQHITNCWPVIRDYNLMPYPIWHNNQMSGHPSLFSVFATSCAVILYPRWYFWYKGAIAKKVMDLENWIVEDKEWDLWRLVPTPYEAWYHYPDWAWDYWRDYSMELDHFEDGVTISSVYGALWKEGSVIDVRDAIDFLDAHPEYIFNKKRPMSDMDKMHAEARQAFRFPQWQTFAENYIAPKSANRIYCPDCGQYMGYFDGALHRPDGTAVHGAERLYCVQNHTHVWEQNLMSQFKAHQIVVAPELD